MALMAGAAWARSHYVADQYVWRVPSSGPGTELVDSRALETRPGKLVFRERTAVM